MNNWLKIKDKIYKSRLDDINNAFKEVEDNIASLKTVRSEWTTPVESWIVSQITERDAFSLTAPEYTHLNQIVEDLDQTFLWHYGEEKEVVEGYKQEFIAEYLKFLTNKDEDIKLEVSAELIEEKKFPLHLFAEWYLANFGLPKEQFQEALGSFWGDVWKHAAGGAATGATAGALAGGIPTGGLGTFAGTGLGALAGAGVGGLYGAGKNLFHSVASWLRGKKEFETTKEEALVQLNKLKELSKGFDLDPNFSQALDTMIEKLGTTKAYKVNNPEKPKPAEVLPAPEHKPHEEPHAEHKPDEPEHHEPEEPHAEHKPDEPEHHEPEDDEKWDDIGLEPDEEEPSHKGPHEPTHSEHPPEEPPHHEPEPEHEPAHEEPPHHEPEPEHEPAHEEPPHHEPEPEEPKGDLNFEGGIQDFIDSYENASMVNKLRLGMAYHNHNISAHDFKATGMKDIKSHHSMIEELDPMDLPVEMRPEVLATADKVISHLKEIQKLASEKPKVGEMPNEGDGIPVFDEAEVRKLGHPGKNRIKRLRKYLKDAGLDDEIDPSEDTDNIVASIKHYIEHPQFAPGMKLKGKHESIIYKYKRMLQEGHGPIIQKKDNWYAPKLEHYKKLLRS
jgi:hypothetical protein